MDTRIKVVSLGVLCFLAGVAFMVSMGASRTAEAPSSRYQVAATAHAPGAFVLDTQMGHLWARALSYEAESVDLGTPEHPTCETFRPPESPGQLPAEK
jgi:hypothetical protein